MRLKPETKDQTTCILIHAELIMWGEEFLKIIDNKDGSVDVRWFSMMDGGSIAGQGEKTVLDVDFVAIKNYVFTRDFPDNEDEGMNISWELQCGDQNDDALTYLEFGYWNKDLLRSIITFLGETLKDLEPFVSFTNTLEA